MLDDGMIDKDGQGFVLCILTFWEAQRQTHESGGKFGLFVAFNPLVSTLRGPNYSFA